jgi:hypothetical protein
MDDSNCAEVESRQELGAESKISARVHVWVKMSAAKMELKT